MIYLNNMENTFFEMYQKALFERNRLNNLSLSDYPGKTYAEKQPYLNIDIREGKALDRKLKSLWKKIEKMPDFEFKMSKLFRSMISDKNPWNVFSSFTFFERRDHLLASLILKKIIDNFPGHHITVLAKSLLDNFHKTGEFR